MGEVDQVFSFGELLVLIDVEGVGAMSVPLPTPAEASTLTATAAIGVAPCLGARGKCRFRTGLAHLFEPPVAELIVSPIHAVLAISRFPDEDIWANMFEWLSGSLADSLVTTTAPGAPDGYRVHAGRGVIATLGFTRPNVRQAPRDLVIEVGVRRDEPAAATVHRLFGLAADVRIAPPDDGNWRELPTTWPMHLECSRHKDTVRFRFSAPHHDNQLSTAGLCEEWSWRWLDLCAGTPPAQHDRKRVAWDLGAGGHVSMVRGDGHGRRDAHELHVPAAWFAT
jgi:hypothetical protein